MNDEVNDERPLRKHFTQKVKRATEDLTKMASIEKLRNRIIAPNMTNSISNREYVDVQVSENSILDHDISPHEMWNNVTEENEPQNINISQEVTFEREQGANNEEAFDLSDNEIVFQNEIDQEDDASEGSNDDDDIDDDEDINENQFETEEQKANYVAENLREWAVYDGNISKKKLDNLLLRLNPIFPTLPKSYKTLLRTPKHLDIHVLPDGSMLWYKGIVRNLNGMLLNEYLNKFGNIIIDVNMDGLPITKSTRLKFWPVLGRLVHTDNDPFLISLYLGEWDPIDVHSYLHDFVTEVEHLLEHGYMNNDFIVAKFLPTSEDDNVYYEVALAKWLVRINEEMKGILLWPNNDAVAGKLVRSEAKADETWRQLEVEVKRYYETYIAARNAAKGFEEFASAYESDSNSKMGRGMRRKRIMKLSSSDDDLSDSDVKKSRKQNKSKIAAAPLPPPPPPAGSSRTKSLSCASKENIPIIKVISNKKQRKEVTSSASTTAIIKHQPQQKHPLLDKIVNLRQQAADKAQQRKQAMCLENIQKVSMKRKATNSTLCSELPMKVSETDGSSRSETHSTPILLNSQSEKSYNNESNDIQSILPQSPCRSLDENQNPCSSFTRDDVQIPLKPSSNSSESDEFSQGPLRTSTTKLTTRTELDVYLGKLDKKVDDMRVKIGLILINQCKINRLLLPEEKILRKPPNFPPLPLETLEQFKMFEDFLSNDMQLSDTCYYLKSLSLGNNEARAVSKLMSNLLSNSLAQEFNFDGHGTKLAFKSTKLWELVQGALVLKFENSDLSEALKSVRSWLRNAKGRRCD